MRIGTVGTGRIVDEFLNALKDVENAQCVAVYSRKEETARKLADKHQVKRIYTDYNSLLSDESIDFIYIALPNSLHYDYALKALEKGKNVICEKPFTSTVQEAKKLVNLAKEKHLFLFEAITTLNFPNYEVIKESLSQLGAIKLVQCNYSQYSSRYDQLLEGEVTNIFSPEFSGGCLVDINIYNLHFVTGLFGKAKEVRYFSNKADNGIDTSGIVILRYDDFLCTCTGAKDSESPSFIVIQGTKGYIKVNTPPSRALSFEIKTKDQMKVYEQDTKINRMTYEIRNFYKLYQTKNYQKCYELLEHSLKVVETAAQARKAAGIVFTADTLDKEDVLHKTPN